MRNFARIIKLATCDCCAVREELTRVRFIFWQFDGEKLLNFEGAIDYRYHQVVDQLFIDNDVAMQEQAEKVLAQCEVPIQMHDDDETELNLKFTGDTLHKILGM